MDKSALKKVIKPLIKECLKEVLFEEGLIKIAQENMQKTSNTFQDKEKTQNYYAKEREFMKKNSSDAKINLQEAKNKLLKEVAMSGFDPFEGSEPIPSDSSNQIHEEGVQEGRLLAGINGSGIDISNLMSANKRSWNFYNSALNKSKKE